MSAAWLMVLASFLFAAMGVCVKMASTTYSVGEVVFYRGLTGLLAMFVMARIQGCSLRTSYPLAHLWRSMTGVTALSLWFYAIGQLPLSTAVTLNYTASVWIALFLIGSSVVLGGAKVDLRLVTAIIVGFVGIGFILKPTLHANQLGAGLVGLLSGMLSAMAYLQVATLGRLGEPEARIVFLFSLASVVVGGGMMAYSGYRSHHWPGALWLLGVGVLATAAQWALTRAYATGRSLVNASLQYLGVAYSFLFGVLIFQDPITPPALIGMLLVVGAGLVSTRMRPLAANQTVTPQTPER